MMFTRPPRSVKPIFTLLLITLITLQATAQEQQQLVPKKVSPSPLITQILNDPLTKPETKIRLQINHGQFDTLPEDQQNAPQTLLAKYDLNNPILQAETTPPLIRAQAAHLRGDHQQVLTLLDKNDSIQATLLKGQAHAATGNLQLAIKTLTPLRELANNPTKQTPDDQVAIAIALTELATLEGRPADDYQQILNILSDVQQKQDPLNWPALIAQGQLLMDKDSITPGIRTLHEALALNPGASEIWYELGRFAAKTFDFSGAERAVAKLNAITENHLYASIIAVESALTQKDTKTAQTELNAALKRYPRHRRLLALNVAIAAMLADTDLEQQTIKAFDTVAGKNPLAHYLAGRFLSLTRQYDRAANYLAQAIKRQPNWPKPQIELGLLLSQAGYETRSLEVLQGVTQLDPFNKRAKNTLILHQELAGYETIETENFIIRYKKGIDAALAHDMPEHLEQMHREIAALYETKLDRKTQIEILPDLKSFAVRITGMPDIWTIAACTGPVVALTPPREGKGQHGYFDWKRVMRHEYTHTITLGKTGNRIPHWMTEAIAVQEEHSPRTFNDCQMLAHAFYEKDLFDLTSINWGFIRPRKPHHRAQAYTQANWMVQFIIERYSQEKLINILELSNQGVSEYEVIQKALGITNDQFMEQFLVWAEQQIKAWGLEKQEDLTEQLKQLHADNQLTLAKIDSMLQEHPAHRTLLKKKIELLEKENDTQATLNAIKAYAKAVPVDTWADEKLAKLYLQLDQPKQAIPHLKKLDKIDQEDGRYALQLVELYRQLGDTQAAADAAQNAVYRLSYDANIREKAALLTLKAGQTDNALHHLKILTYLEPEQDIHYTRLAAMYHKLNQKDKAKQAATQALKLNPDSPAKRFLD